jgi:hypothetical protein
MTFLGLTPGKTPDSEVSVGFRRGWPSSFKLVLSSAGGAAIAFAAVELLERQPKEGFALLGLWGPWPFIVLIAIVLLGAAANQFVEVLRTALSQGLQSSQQGAEAAVRTAEALTKLADQGGRQFEEVRRLAMYASQEFPSVYTRLDRQDELMKEIWEQGKELNRDVVKALIERNAGDVGAGTK